jgi:hypothetical protein
MLFGRWLNCALVCVAVSNCCGQVNFEAGLRWVPDSSGSTANVFRFWLEGRVRQNQGDNYGILIAGGELDQPGTITLTDPAGASSLHRGNVSPFVPSMGEH